MSYTIINVTSEFLIEEIEYILKSFFEYTYQVAMVPELRQKLIVHVLSQITNSYAVIGDAQQPAKATDILDLPWEQQLHLESVIYDSILYFLQENAGWVNEHPHG